MKQLQKIFKVLADPNRLRIIKLLEERKMCVCELAHCLEITQPSVSRHLKKLKLAAIIEEEQDSLWTNYLLVKSKDSCVAVLLKNLKVWLNNHDVIRSDLAKSKKVHRQQLCCR